MIKKRFGMIGMERMKKNKKKRIKYQTLNKAVPSIECCVQEIKLYKNCLIS